MVYRGVHTVQSVCIVLCAASCLIMQALMLPGLSSVRSKSLAGDTGLHATTSMSQCYVPVMQNMEGHSCWKNILSCYCGADMSQDESHHSRCALQHVQLLMSPMGPVK